MNQPVVVVFSRLGQASLAVLFDGQHQLTAFVVVLETILRSFTFSSFTMQEVETPFKFQYFECAPKNVVL